MLISKIYLKVFVASCFVQHSVGWLSSSVVESLFGPAAVHTLRGKSSFGYLHATDGIIDESTAVEDPKKRTWQLLLENFQGDFDNYNQVVEDRRQGMLPREGGGHENFHCTLIPVTDNGRLAAFYFDGNPQRIFRFRYYELLPLQDVFDQDGVVMKLYTLQPELERLLREKSEEPLSWPQLFSSFNGGAPLEAKIKYLPKCEITWSLDLDPAEHSYVDGVHEDEMGLHAVMVHGEATVNSTIIPGVKIRIIDQLSLYRDLFYINDRGMDPESGDFIYGNHYGVPYRLERVATLQNGQRTVVRQNLKWTLGKSWRSEEDYKQKIDAIGGPSVQMKAPPPKNKD